MLITRKKLKFKTIYVCFTLFFTSCDEPSDIVVKIYGIHEYNCTMDEYRVLTNNPILPFMKKNKWYTRDEFHDSHVRHTLSPWENLPINEDSLTNIKPKKEQSYDLLNELIKDVDCKNPVDILF